MYQQQPQSTAYRLRPVSTNRPSKHQQRRSVAVTSDLQRYYNSPQFYIYPQQHAPSTITNPSRNSRPKLAASQRPSTQRPIPFPTISVEKQGTLSRQTKKEKIEDENVSTGAASHFLRWLRKRQQPKPTSQPPPPTQDRSNWTGSLPRNFSIRLPTNSNTKPPTQKAKVTKFPVKTQKQPEKQKPSFMEVEEGHYDNAPLSTGYYNVLTPSQEATASKYATISRKSLPRYDSQTANFNTLPRKMAPPPPEPTPDYSDSRSSSSSLSPTPPTARVRFNLSQKVAVEEEIQPVADHLERLPRPRGFFARTFDRKIYKRLKPLIQIRGIRVDEKDIGRRQRAKSPQPLQRSILLNGGKEKLTQQTSLPANISLVPFPTTQHKRPAPPPPTEEERLSPPYDNENEVLIDKNGGGVCYVQGNKIEYRLEWTETQQLLVHYESRNLNDELGNTADAEIIAELLAESEKGDLGEGRRKMAILPQRGTLTDMEYGPGLVKRLREKFTQMAKQSSSTVIATNYKRFSSMDDILSESPPFCSEDGLKISQTLPRMRTSKSANENLSSTTTGYSSEESSSQSSEHRTSNRFPTNPTEIALQERQISIKSPEVSRIVISDNEIDENAAPRIPIRSLREKFEQQVSVDQGVRVDYSPRSNSAHTVARYHNFPSKTSDDFSTNQMKKSVTFPTSQTLPRNSEHNDYSNDGLINQNNESANDLINNGNMTRPSSPSLSTCSEFSAPFDDPIPGTSDELESIASQDEEYKAPMNFNQKQFNTLPFAYKNNQQQQQPMESANKRRVTFKLPLDNPVMRKNEEEIQIGRPGSTPMNDAPAKSAALKDASGILEVHRLLDKFNAKRLADQQQEDPNSFAVVSKKYDSPPIKTNSSEKPPIPRNDQSSVQQSNVQHSNFNNSLPARKSLSARYLESKQQQVPSNELFDSMGNDSLENVTPIIDCNGMEQEDENTSISSMDSLDVVEEIVDCQSHETMFATECGPVRQSLLNLVLQSDIPELLEAMAEDLHFEFENFSPPMQTTNGIILNGSRRRQTGQKHNRSQRICFDNESPTVFTYLDESSALEEGKWHEGRPITYEDYLKLVHDTQDQTARQALELSKWRNVMQIKLVDQSDDSALKATASQFANTSLQPPITISPSSSRTPTPDEIERFSSLSRYPFGSSTQQRPIPARHECGTSAI